MMRVSLCVYMNTHTGMSYDACITVCIYEYTHRYVL